MEKGLFEEKLAGLLSDISCRKGIPLTDENAQTWLTHLRHRKSIVNEHPVRPNARIPSQPSRRKLHSESEVESQRLQRAIQY